MATPPVPGVRYVEGFLRDHAQLLAWAIAEVPWDDRIQARKTASFGVPYDYAGLTYAKVPFPAPIEALRARVEAELAFPANNSLLNYYPTGASRMGFHSDSAMGLVEGSGVAIVSLGAQRPLRFRRTAQLDDRFDVVLAPGSLLWMDQAVQQIWQHALPRSSTHDPRISVTFRAVLV